MRKLYKLKCTCQVDAETEHLTYLCPACEKRMLERHEASAAERAIARAALPADKEGAK